MNTYRILSITPQALDIAWVLKQRSEGKECLESSGMVVGLLKPTTSAPPSAARNTCTSAASVQTRPELSWHGGMSACPLAEEAVGSPRHGLMRMRQAVGSAADRWMKRPRSPLIHRGQLAPRPPRLQIHAAVFDWLLVQPTASDRAWRRSLASNMDSWSPPGGARAAGIPWRDRRGASPAIRVTAAASEIRGAHETQYTMTPSTARTCNSIYKDTQHGTELSSMQDYSTYENRLSISI